jgi:hypothetical protein
MLLSVATVAALVAVAQAGDPVFTVLPNGDGTCYEDFEPVAEFCKGVVNYPYFIYSVHDHDRLRKGAVSYEQGTSQIQGECLPSAVQFACIWYGVSRLSCSPAVSFHQPCCQL